MDHTKITPWFEPGFDEAVKASIEALWPSDATLICHDEAHRWARILLEACADLNVELNDGMFHAHGDPLDNHGHSWLEVNGYIFDPTAMQFSGEIAHSCYVSFDSCDGEDLRQRLHHWHSEDRGLDCAVGDDSCDMSP